MSPSRRTCQQLMSLVRAAPPCRPPSSCTRLLRRSGDNGSGRSAAARISAARSPRVDSSWVTPQSIPLLTLKQKTRNGLKASATADASGRRFYVSERAQQHE
jgi:hypothetical protein